MRRVAVIGSGISGLSVAYHLAGEAQVTLFEAGDYFGGHTHTVDVTAGTRQGKETHGVDTGFLVFNERTYPELIRLLRSLDVETSASDMSFSVRVPDHNLEWSGSTPNSVFAQRRNLLRPGFLRMLGEVLRFNKLATAIAEQNSGIQLQQPVGDFLKEQGFSREFRDWYFLPMIGCIWSCPTDQMLRFPISSLIRFCHNHGLIQIAHRPQWFTVKGGARHYVKKMLRHIPDARLNTPVLGVRRLNANGTAGVLVMTRAGTERFDDVVMACHSDQSLALLTDPSDVEREVLGAIRYHPNRAVLHTDELVLPRRPLAWAAWNYERAVEDSREQASVCLHYLINKLQPLPFTEPVIVSLNPVTEPRDDRIQGVYHYAHPVFDMAAVAAQSRIHELQGKAHTWFCGAWTRYGFHEDGLMSGLAVVDGLRRRWAGSPLQEEAA
jgi:predicted NAD/FAD-binding protein